VHDFLGTVVSRVRSLGPGEALVLSRPSPLPGEKDGNARIHYVVHRNAVAPAGCDYSLAVCTMSTAALEYHPAKVDPATGALSHATPLLLRLVPTGFLPILLGDYLAVHCGVYGLLTAATLGWAARGAAPTAGRAALPAVALAALALAAYAILGIGTAIDQFVLGFMPGPHRLWLVPVLLCGTLPWFLADEWATRGPGAARLAYPATKALFLLSLLGAVALDPPRLFFLIIIVPVMLLFLVVFGLFGRWSFRATGSPVPAAIANAVALAWAMAATFPIVPR
jgi:hypothetical protein